MHVRANHVRTVEPAPIPEAQTIVCVQLDGEVQIVQLPVSTIYVMLPTSVINPHV
jgi:hypothetical protein